MIASFEKEMSFLWDLKSSNAARLKAQMDVHAEGIPAIFSLWPLMTHFSTRLLKWPVTLDYMKLLPKKVNVKIYQDFVSDEDVRFDVAWSEEPSLEVPLPHCSARVFQADTCRAEFIIEFYQRPPRDKPLPFEWVETQHQTLVPWAKAPDQVKQYLSAVGSEDPIFSSHDFAVAMGMARPLIPDVYLVFLLWHAHESRERKVHELAVSFAQPPLSKSDLFLHHNIEGEKVTGFLCDDLDRPIFSDFLIQWGAAGSSWPAN